MFDPGLVLVVDCGPRSVERGASTIREWVD